MYTTKIDSTGPQDTVFLFKDGREVARMSLDTFVKLPAVRYVRELAVEEATSSASSRG